jgi:hypothetical protein
MLRKMCNKLVGVGHWSGTFKFGTFLFSHLSKNCMGSVAQPLQAEASSSQPIQCI